MGKGFGHGKSSPKAYGNAVDAPDNERLEAIVIRFRQGDKLCNGIDEDYEGTISVDKAPYEGGPDVWLGVEVIAVKEHHLCPERRELVP